MSRFIRSASTIKPVPLLRARVNNYSRPEMRKMDFWQTSDIHSIFRKSVDNDCLACNLYKRSNVPRYMTSPRMQRALMGFEQLSWLQAHIFLMNLRIILRLNFLILILVLSQVPPGWDYHANPRTPCQEFPEYPSINRIEDSKI